MHAAIISFASFGTGSAVMSVDPKFPDDNWFSTGMLKCFAARRIFSSSAFCTAKSARLSSSDEKQMRQYQQTQAHHIFKATIEQVF